MKTHRPQFISEASKCRPYAIGRVNCNALLRPISTITITLLPVTCELLTNRADVIDIYKKLSNTNREMFQATQNKVAYQLLARGSWIFSRTTCWDVSDVAAWRACQQNFGIKLNQKIVIQCVLQPAILDLVIREEETAELYRLESG